MNLSRFLSIGCVLLLCSAVLVHESFAGSNRRKGTAGAQELLIPIGGSGMALGGSIVPSVRGAEALYWNPAGAANLDGAAEVFFSHMNYIADINVEYASFSARMGDESAIGLAITSLGFGDIPVTTVDRPDGTGETYSPTYLVVGATYSRQMTDRIAFGATGKLISEQIVGVGATGFAFDFGIQYHAPLSGIRFGVTLKNLGPAMQYGGSDLETIVQLPGTEPGSIPRAIRTPAQEFDLPSTLEFGVGYDMKFGDALVANFNTTFEHQNYSSDNFRFGAQVSWNNMLYFRGGYLLSPDTPSEEQLYSYSAGLGVNLALSQSFNVTFDYAYRAADIFGDNQVFSLKLGI